MQASQALGYLEELITTAGLMGVLVRTKQSEDFDLTTHGEFDPTSNTITLFYEKELPISVATVFVMAHELRHAYQFHTGFHRPYWLFSIGVGEKPPAEVRDAIEKDADDWATKYLKGRGSRVPKHLIGDYP